MCRELSAQGIETNLIIYNMNISKKVLPPSGHPHPLYIAAVAVIALGAGFGIAQATLTGGPSIISAPDVIADDPPEGAVNDRQEAFDERQAVTLTQEIQCDSTILEPGEVVSSHMIFYNTRGVGITSDANRTWTFEDEIVCVMSNRNGLYQAQTDNLLGAPGTSYPGPFSSRGLESDDSYSVNGNQITVTMNAEEPGDWIRVVTKVAVPPDTTPPVVYCDPGVNPAGKEKNEKKQGNDKFYELIGADDVDGAVDIYLTDSESEITFGPFDSGDNVQLTEAKGATPRQEIGNGEVDYRISTQGQVMISATDEAGNEGEAVCTS